jgi:hypothetical protein
MGQRVGVGASNGGKGGMMSGGLHQKRRRLRRSPSVRHTSCWNTVSSCIHAPQLPAGACLHGGQHVNTHTHTRPQAHTTREGYSRLKRSDIRERLRRCWIGLNADPTAFATVHYVEQWFQSYQCGSCIYSVSMELQSGMIPWLTVTT